MNSALLVVDMLNDFIDKKGSLYAKNSEKIVPVINAAIDEFTSINKGLCIFANDSHSENDAEFKHYPKHCVTGTWGAEIYPEIKIPKVCLRANKTTFSALSNGELLYLLKSMRIGIVRICGVVTEVCVYHTAVDAIVNHFETVVIEDAICSLNEDDGKRLIDGMISQGIRIIRFGSR